MLQTMIFTVYVGIFGSVLLVQTPGVWGKIFKWTTEYSEFVDGVETLGMKWVEEMRLMEEGKLDEDKTPKDSFSYFPEAKREKKQQKTKKKPPPEAIGLFVEGIEHSDFGLSREDSNYQRSRPAIGFQTCANPADDSPFSLVKVFYKSQPTSNNFEPEAIRALCYASGGMRNFCACNEAGLCLRSKPDNVPIYAELAPYCDPTDGCHVYLELYHGSLRSEDWPFATYTHRFNAGPVGHRSPYMKVAAVSCDGCERIGNVMRREKNQQCQVQGGEFMENHLDQQDVREIISLC